MEKMTMKNTAESSKIDNAKTDTATHIKGGSINTSVNKDKGHDGVSESPKAEHKNSTRKHSVMYLAGGIWKDSTGKFWCRDEKKNCITSAVFTDDEYKDRSDIQYMVQYGAMKDVVVE